MLLQSLTILATILIVYLINNSALADYGSYILALLIIFSTIYITYMRRKNNDRLFSGTLPEIFGITAVVLLIINSTGNLNSSLFFFLYFLLFGLAFLAKPATSLVFLLGIILFFIPEALKGDTTTNFIKLGSLLLIAPIAYFFGREFERRRIISDKVEAKTDEIISEAKALREDGKLKGQDQADSLDEIIEEASSLKRDIEA